MKLIKGLEWIVRIIIRIITATTLLVFLLIPTIILLIPTIFDRKLRNIATNKYLEFKEKYLELKEKYKAEK